MKISWRSTLEQLRDFFHKGRKPAISLAFFIHKFLIIFGHPVFVSTRNDKGMSMKKTQLLLSGLVLVPFLASTTYGTATEGSPPDPRKALSDLKVMGSIKGGKGAGLKDFGAVFLGDCPVLLTNQSIHALVAAPVSKRPRPGSIPEDYFEKQNLTIGGRTFSANLKPSGPGDSSFNSVERASKAGKFVFGALGKGEEIRDKDTDAVRKGASLCSYKVFQMPDQAAYDKLFKELEENVDRELYGNVEVMQRHIRENGGELITSEGSLRVAVSQPNG